MQQRVVRAPHEIDLNLILGPLRRGRFDPTMRFDGAELWRAWRTPCGPVTLRLADEGARVRAHAWGEGAAWALDHVEALLGFDDDPSGFVPRHPLVREMHRRLPMLRLARTGTIMDALVPSVLEQKVTGGEAWRSYEKLVRRFGERAPGPAPLMMPPEPAALSRVPPWMLHPLNVEARRAETLRRVASAARRMEEAAAMSPEHARARLRAVPGVGVWTAAEVTKLSHGDPDVVSVGDFHLKNVVAWVLAGEPRATDERMLELLEPYRGHRQRAIRLIEASGMGAPRYGPRMPRRDISRL